MNPTATFAPEQPRDPLLRQPATACACGGTSPSPESLARLADLEAQVAALRASLGVTAAPPPGTPPGVLPDQPAPESQPAPADDAMAAETDARLADCEQAIAELAEGLTELQAWVADRAAQSLEDGVSPLPEPMPMSAAFGDNKAPPFTKADGPGPGGPPKATGPHEFVDEDGDGKCDVCGKAEGEHGGTPTESAAITKRGPDGQPVPGRNARDERGPRRNAPRGGR